MKSGVLVLMVFAAVHCSKDLSFDCCLSGRSVQDRIYESVLKFNLTEQRRSHGYCDHMECPKVKKVQNVQRNFQQAFPLLSLPQRIRNKRCRAQILDLMHGLQNSSSWAVEMFDASSKFPSGLITANTFQFGNYDQCVNAVSEKHSIKGKYCLANVHFSPLQDKYPPFHRSSTENEFSLHYDPYSSVLEKFKVTKDLTKKRRNVFHSGMCVPDSCTPADAEVIMNHFILPRAREFGYRTVVEIPHNACTTNDPKPLTAGGKILGLVIAGVVALVVVFTVWDLIDRTKDGASDKVEGYVEAFSLTRNIPKFFAQMGDGSMNVFNGMKSLSMVLIIMGHRCMASCGGPFFNPEFLEERYRKIQNILLLNGTLIVDTFFLIGGYLTFLALSKEYKKNQKLQSIKIYLHRWLRITPVYMLVIFFYGHLLEHMGTGPIWTMKVGREAERCRTNWWTNFLFINNYVNADSLCMFQSWYVTCDMHFILLAPIVVKLVLKSPKNGPFVFKSLIAGSLLTIFIITYCNKYDGVLRVYIKTFEDLATSFTFNRVYIRTHNRATPYFSGMAAAYVYIKLKQAHHKFSLWQVWVLSASAVVCALSAICGAWLFYIPGREYDALENALYASLHRLLWAVSMSWIALAGGTQAFGVIQPVLAQKFFIPFSKLSYTTFLVHGAIQMYTTASLRTPEYMSFPKLYWMTCGDVMLSFFSAFLLHIFFEAPIKGVQNLIFSKPKKIKSS